MTVFHGSGEARHITDVRGLQDALDDKAGTADVAALRADVKTLGIPDVAGLDAALGDKQPTLTGIDDVPGLTSALSAKQPNLTGTDDVPGLTSALSAKQPTLTSTDDVPGLTSALSAKQPNLTGTDDVPGLTSALSAKQPNLTSTDDVPGLTSALSGKAPKHRIIEEYDTAGRNFGGGWARGRTWTNQSYSGGSKLLIAFHIPARNDTDNWGGLYTEVKGSFDNGASWFSFGNSGFDGPMCYGARDIGYYDNSFLWDPGKATNFTFRVQFWHRSYNHTVQVNHNHGDTGQGRWRTRLRIEEIFA